MKFFPDGSPLFDSIQIIEDSSLVEMVEDWSRVRSKARARRRRAKHRQNIEIRVVPKEEIFYVGNRLIMHPRVAAELRARFPEAFR